jgi:hypothetical protein
MPAIVRFVRVRYRCWFGVVVMLGWCGIAAAQEAAPQEAAPQESADALFERGVADMMAGNLDAACPAIAESYRLEPLAGALFTLAECEAQWGKPAAALAHYENYLGEVTRMSAADRAQQEERRVIAVRQVDALRLRVPKLTLVVDASVPADAALTIDGEPATPDAPIALEPGAHTITLSAKGYKTASREEVLQEGEARSVKLALVPLGPPPKLPPPPPDDGDVLQTTAIVVAAVGAASMIVGAILGGVALSKAGVVDDHCVDRVCDAEGKDAADGGQTLADASTATLVFGGVALTAGVVLWLAAPSAAETPRAAETPSAARSQTPLFDARGVIIGVGGVW